MMTFCWNHRVDVVSLSWWFLACQHNSKLFRSTADHQNFVNDLKLSLVWFLYSLAWPVKNQCYSGQQVSGCWAHTYRVHMQQIKINIIECLQCIALLPFLTTVDLPRRSKNLPGDENLNFNFIQLQKENLKGADDIKRWDVNLNLKEWCQSVLKSFKLTYPTA